MPFTVATGFYSGRPGCLAIAVGATIFICAQPIAVAADFSNAQHTYVPPSLYERRIDYNSAREDAAVGDYTYEHHVAREKLKSSVSATLYRNAPAASHSSHSSAHPYGKLPPPPPVAAEAHAVVPPPPPYTSTLTTVAKDLHEQVKKAAANPAVQNAFQQLKKQAEEYARSGKLNEAKHALAKALQLTPHDKTLLRELGSISLERARQFSQSQDFDKAIKFARQALAFDAGSSDARKVLDGLLQKTGINPADASARLKAAELLASQGRNDDAWVEYQAADRLRPSADARIGMGNIAVRAGQKERAKAEYQAAAEVEPTSGAAHRQLGILKLSQGDIVGANAELSRALVLDPKDKDAARALIELWQNQVSRVPGANSHLGLARAYQLAGDLQSAQTEYRTVVRIDPDNPHLPAARQSFKLALSRQEAEQAAEAARTLESQGALPEAYQKVLEAVRLSPGDADLRVYEGHLLEQMRRYAAAKEAYLAALKINPHHLLAAARIKNLPAEATAIAALPGTSQPAVGAAAVGTGTSAMRPPARASEVSSISNFAVALRNHMLLQKTQIQKVEDAAHDVISQIGKTGPSEALVTASATSAGAATDPVGSSVESALARARAALAEAKGKPGDTVPSSSASASSAASAPAAASTASAAPAVAPPINDELNRLLGAGGSSPASAPSATPTAIAPPVSANNAGLPLPPGADGMPPLAPPIVRSVNGAPLPVPSASPGDSVPSDSAALALPYTPAPAMAATATTTAAPAETSDTLPPLAPPIAPNHYSPASPLAAPEAGLPQLHGSLPLSGSTVAFQLLGASPKLSGVELNVVLKNDADMPLSIPKNVHGLIKYTNRHDAEVKVDFDSAVVPPHGAVKGVIRVPYDKADPTADLLLPNLLPPGSATRDVHLTTNLAFR